MKKLFSILILLVVLIVVIRVPGLQAEDWAGQRIPSPLSCGREDGIPVLPILCLEEMGAEQLDAVRGMYAPGVALSAIDASAGENRIILWDEPQGTSGVQIGGSSSYGNNISYSVVTAINYK